METKIAVIRVRGDVNQKTGVLKTFESLNLKAKNWCVVVDKTPSMLGMVATVKDFVTWGDVTPDVLKDLATRGTEDKDGIDINGKKYSNLFKLNSPVKGYGRNGIKFSFTDGGALGNRGDKIAALIKRMI